MAYVIIRPRASFEDEKPVLEGKTVYEPDAPVDTGLLDAAGNKICRTMEPIGFIPIRERD